MRTGDLTLDVVQQVVRKIRQESWEKYHLSYIVVIYATLKVGNYVPNELDYGNL